MNKSNLKNKPELTDELEREISSIIDKLHPYDIWQFIDTTFQKEDYGYVINTQFNIQLMELLLTGLEKSTNNESNEALEYLCFGRDLPTVFELRLMALKTIEQKKYPD